jgi:hypothetical protein
MCIYLTKIKLVHHIWISVYDIHSSTCEIVTFYDNNNKYYVQNNNKLSWYKTKGEIELQGKGCKIIQMIFATNNTF